MATTNTVLYFTINIFILHVSLQIKHSSANKPVDASQAELLAREAEVSQVGVSQALDQILLHASCCGYNNIHLTQRNRF